MDNKEETIEVSKDFLEKLNKKIEAVEKKNEFLESVADKKMKAQYYARHKEQLPINVKLRTWPTDEDGDQVILGWRTIRDEGLFRNPLTNVQTEIQEIEIILENGKKIEMPLATWNLRYGHVECEQIGTETDDKGNLALKLKRKDNGKEYTISVVFVN